MKKTIRLTEEDLIKLVKKITNEQYSHENEPISKKHPINNPLWKEMEDYIHGDGPEIMKFIPNKQLIIGTSDGKKIVPVYTIIRH